MEESLQDSSRSDPRSYSKSKRNSHLAEGNALVDAIVPLEARFQLSLRDIIGEKASQPLIDWKYFDGAFNKARLRGICAIKSGQLVGFIGIIPVTLRRGREEVGDNWLCDWKIKDPVSLKGLGGAIARDALAHARRLMAYGGSEVAKKRWPRHAVKCDFGAGVTLKRFLRVEGVLAQLGRSVGRPPLPRSVRNLRTTLSNRVKYGVEAGVSRDVPLDFQIRKDWAPYYSMDDLEWQLERCPLVEAVTLAPSGYSSRVLLWHPPGNPQVCKVALFSPQGSDDERACVKAAVAYASEIGAHTLIVNCSRLDTERLKCLRAAGFIRGKMRIPLHLLNVDESAVPDSLAGLSCLDADMGNRFG